MTMRYKRFLRKDNAIQKIPTEGQKLNSSPSKIRLRLFSLKKNNLFLSFLVTKIYFGVLIFEGVFELFKYNKKIFIDST
jgi:hypothetical protein